MDITRIRKPRCFMLYALAPDNITPSQANQTINQLCQDKDLPLTIYHDHFLGQAGGIIIFFATTPEERNILQNKVELILEEWQYTLHPLIFSHNPAALDEQIAYTLRAYRDTDWEVLQKDKRPSYGNPREEAETAQET